MPYIDYRALRDQLRIDRVLYEIGYRATRVTPTTAYGPCPLRCCSAVGTRFYRRCCSINFVENIWFCHECKRGGNALDLFARAKNMTPYYAAQELCRLLEIPLPLRSDNPR